MKIWNAYGSEHSMNLVMVGQFKNIDEAEKTKELIETITERLHKLIDINSDPHLTRFPDEISQLLQEKEIFILNPEELEQFNYENTLDLEGDKLILKTDETDVSAFLKILVHKGAKVEVYSAHNYPDEPYGRGK